MLQSVIALILAACLPVAGASAAASSAQQVVVRVADRAAGKSAPRQDPKQGRMAPSVQVVALKYSQAKDVAKALSRTMKLSRKRPDLVMIPHPEANALLLRGTRPMLEAALDAIARLDVQPAFEGRDAITQIVVIESGSAVEIARTLNRFLETRDSDDLRIEPHAPDNIVLVRGTKSRVTDALDLIAQLDKTPAAKQAKPKWVILEHTRAAEVAATLIRFLNLASNAGPNRGLKIDANKERNAIVLRGTAEQTRQAIELIARIDWAAGKKAPSKKAPAKKEPAEKLPPKKHTKAR